MPKVHIMNVPISKRQEEAVKRIEEIFIHPSITDANSELVNFNSCGTSYKFIFNRGLYRYVQGEGYVTVPDNPLSEFDWDEHQKNEVEEVSKLVKEIFESLSTIREILVHQNKQIDQLFEELEHIKKPKNPEEQSDENSLYKNWILGLLANIKSGDPDVATQAKREIQVEYLNQIGAMPQDFTYEGLGDSLITHFEEPDTWRSLKEFATQALDTYDEEEDSPIVTKSELEQIAKEHPVSKGTPVWTEEDQKDLDDVYDDEVSPPETVSRDTVDLVRGKLDTFNRSVRDQLDRLPSGMGEVRAIAERLLTTLNDDMDELLSE